ncbi:proline racemase family protein [Pseudogulbenkiania subflava]|uniref:Proline racemase n=1 Tax=Pseudogulbenkiania subflava DSM 22618 TaxID=1123014 RepID=A0A1Y6BS74_9NEIS|nr:proline racemase family protein [Pseudogulbenkiania subflava]SMF26657.1 proline racemase [Pseudogulbenkiania subflava DSM 22618]
MNQLPKDFVIETVEMHTGGEPVRIVLNLIDMIQGEDILAKRRMMSEQFDHIRRLLMHEPRGHYDMYGAVLVKPSLPTADLAVLFTHNEGYSTMCGHAVIALARFAVDTGRVAAVAPLTRVGIECPCGLVEAFVEIKDGKTGTVQFESVPAFAFALDLPVTVPGVGEVTVDIGYGGAFYAVVEAEKLGVSLDGRLRDLVEAASALTEAVRNTIAVRHPLADDLSFLYGSILTDGRNTFAAGTSRNVCVFADAEVDRSPTGSGVTARMAIRYAKGQVARGESCEFESLTGALFASKVANPAHLPGHIAVTVNVAGRAYYSGKASWSLEPDDLIGQGFLLH